LSFTKVCTTLKIHINIHLLRNNAVGYGCITH